MKLIPPLASLLVIVSLLALAPRADAATFLLNSTIDGAQANAGAGTGSTATGAMTGTYNDVSGLFSWNISWTPLQGNITVAHFHGPALPNQNAGVQVNFGSISGLTSPSIGSTTISSAQGADLLNHLWYINIHSDLFTGGEIRGQVVPEPSRAVLAAMGLTLGGLRRRRK